MCPGRSVQQSDGCCSSFPGQVSQRQSCCQMLPLTCSMSSHWNRRFNAFRAHRYANLLCCVLFGGAPLTCAHRSFVQSGKHLRSTVHLNRKKKATRCPEAVCLCTSPRTDGRALTVKRIRECPEEHEVPVQSRDLTADLDLICRRAPNIQARRH